MTLKLFRILACACLILAVLTALLWVRSYYTIDAYGWATPAGARSIGANAGGLSLVSWTNPPDGPVTVTPLIGYRAAPAAGRQTNIPPTYSFAGFRYTRRSFSGPVLRAIRIPFYFPVLLLLIVPLLHVRRSLRRPPSPTACKTCGYDLRATPAGSRCPECGAPVPPLATTSGAGP